METKKGLKRWQRLGFVIITGLIFVNVGLFCNIQSLAYWWCIGVLSGTFFHAAGRG